MKLKKEIEKLQGMLNELNQDKFNQILKSDVSDLSEKVFASNFDHMTDSYMLWDNTYNVYYFIIDMRCKCWLERGRDDNGIGQITLVNVESYPIEDSIMNLIKRVKKIQIALHDKAYKLSEIN